MNPLLQYILIERAKSKLKASGDATAISKKKLVAEVRREQVEFVHALRETLFIAIGIFSASFGLRGFLLPNEFIDGTEILAIHLSRKWHMTIGDILLFINIIIFSVGAYLLSIEIALYAILTYLVAAKTVDYVVDGVEEYMGITIISEHSEAIRKMLIEKMGRTCTIYRGKGGYRQNTKAIEIIFTVLTRLEIAKLSTELDKIDKKLL